MMNQQPHLINVPQTLGQQVQAHALTQPEKKALIQVCSSNQTVAVEREITYAMLYQSAQQLAHYLVHCKHQGKCAILSYQNNIDYLIGFLGCLYAGVIAVPVNKPSKSMHLRRFIAIIKNMNSNLLLTSRKEYPSLKSLLDQEQTGRTVNWIVSDLICDESNPASAVTVADTIALDDVAMLQYTSGSTGHPKGAIITQSNLAYNQLMLQKALESNPDTTFVTWVPFHHDLGLILHAVQALYVGATNVIMTPMAFAQNPFFWLQTISTFKATISGAPNFAFKLCTLKTTEEQRKSIDLSHWKVAINAAEPVNTETLNAFAETFKPCGFERSFFMPLYGLAEATVFVSTRQRGTTLTTLEVDQNKISQRMVEPIELPLKNRPSISYVSCGRSWLEEEIVIVDPQTHKRCAEKQVGEIWVRGQHIAKGYWQNPTASNKTFDNDIANEPADLPFLRTQDLGFLVNGELYICGRLSDTIIIHGVNYYPQDIEYVTECVDLNIIPSAVAAFSIAREGEEHLVIVAEVSRHYLSHEPENLHAILLDLRERITAAIIDTFGIAVSDMVFIKQASILRTSSGKIQRSACKQAYLNEQLHIMYSRKEKRYETESCLV